MITRSIAIPSKKNFEDSYASLNSAIDYARLNNVEVHISDNSNDEKKCSAYKKMNAKNVNYFLSNAENAIENFLISKSNVTTQYSSFMADDDLILTLNNKKLEVNKSIIGYRPNFAVWDKKYGLLSFSNFNISESKSVNRLKEYFSKCKGNNNTLYSFFHHSMISDIYNLNALHHPLKVGYNDWAIVLACLAEGYLISDPNTLYVYDNENWTLTNMKEWDQKIERVFSADHSNKNLARYLNLLISLDSFIFIARASSSLKNKEEKLESAIFALLSYKNAFLDFYEKNKSKFNILEQKRIEIFKYCFSFQEILKQILFVLENIIPERIQSFQNFYYEAIEKKWGNI